MSRCTARRLSDWQTERNQLIWRQKRPSLLPQRGTWHRHYRHRRNCRHKLAVSAKDRELPPPDYVLVCFSPCHFGMVNVRLPRSLQNQRSGLVARTANCKSSHPRMLTDFRLHIRAMAAVRGRHSCLPGLPFVPVDQPAYSCHPICLVADGDSSIAKGAS